jgi:hypothetical protein
VSIEASQSYRTHRLRWISVAVATVVLALTLRILSPGWLLYIFGIPYLLGCFVHVIIHAIAARSIKPTLSSAAVPLLSDIALLFAFLLQTDFGDEARPYIPLTFIPAVELGMFNRIPDLPPWWQEWGIVLSVFAFGPVVISWIVLLVMRFRVRRTPTMAVPGTAP